VIISGIASSWPAAQHWTPEALLSSYRNDKLRIGEKMRMTIERYFHYVVNQHEERPVYLFDDDFYKT